MVEIDWIGARDRNRTGTAVLGPADFKSAASTYFATRAEQRGIVT